MKLKPNIKGRELASARILAGLTVRELAMSANISPTTLVHIEARETIRIATRYRQKGHVARQTLTKILTALSEAGVELLPRDAGARLKKAPK